MTRFSWRVAILVVAMASLLAGLPAVLMPAASANAKLSSPRIPASLVSLDQRLKALSINSERVVVRSSFQVPSKDSRRSTHWQTPVVDEVSLAPLRGVERSGPPGHGRVEAIQVGDWEYVRSSAFGVPHIGRAWVSVKVGKSAEGLAGIAGKGPSSVIGKLVAEIASARSAAEVGPAVVDGRATTEFAINTSQKQKILIVGSRSGEQVTHRPVSLHVFFEPDGLPVRIEDLSSGPLALDTITEVLGTGMSVRAHAPPADETMSLAEVEKRAKENTKSKQ